MIIRWHQPPHAKQYQDKNWLSLLKHVVEIYIVICLQKNINQIY